MTDNIEEAEPLNLYTEKKTSIIWDVKFFDSFVIARPIAPAMARSIRKIKDNRFAAEFEEFHGDYRGIQEWLSGESGDTLSVGEKKWNRP